MAWTGKWAGLNRAGVTYDPSRDTQRSHLANTPNAPESQYNRTFRWAEDAVRSGRYGGGGRTEDDYTRAFTDQLDRLRGVAGREGWDFGRSGFGGWQGGTNTGSTGGQQMSIGGFDPYGGSGGGPGGNGQPLVGGAGGGQSGQYNAYLRNNPAARKAMLLQALGMGDPSSQRSFVGKFTAGMAPKFLDAWLPTQGLGEGDTMPGDNYDALIQRFAGLFNGGNFFGNMRGAAQGAINNLGGQMRNLDDDTQFKMLQGFQDLMSSGQNQYLAEAGGNLLEDRLGGYLVNNTNTLRTDPAGAAKQRLYDVFAQDPEIAALLGLRGR